MPDRILMAEFPDDVAALASRAPATPERWLAVTPAAMEELEHRGIPHWIDGDVSPAEELNSIGVGNFSRAEALVEHYDTLLTHACPVFTDRGLKPVSGHLRRVKILLDAIATRLHILQRLRCEGVRVFRKTQVQGPIQTTNADLSYPAQSSVYEDVLGLLATRDGVRVEWVQRPPLSMRRTRAVRIEDMLHRLGRYARRGVAGRLTPRLFGDARPRRVLTLGMGYDVGELLVACRRLGIEAWWLDVSQLRLLRLPDFERCPVRWEPLGRGLQQAIEQVRLPEPGDVEQRLCREEGICYAPLVHRALQRYVRHELPAVLALQTFVEACHRQFGFEALLSPSGPAAIRMRTVFDVCQHHGIPIRVMQHGAYGHVDNPITTYSEFGFDGDFLTWGPGVAAHYESMKRGAVRFVPVGSPTLDRLVARRHQSAKRPTRVMYITNDLRGSSAHYPGGQSWSLDTAYYRLQKAILSLLGRFHDRYDVWLKVPPTMDRNSLARSPIREWLKAQGSRIAVEQRPLVRVIDEPALFIIDHPSTTLLQCLATRAEIVVWTGSMHFSVLPEARRLLQQRATCCETSEGLLAAVEEKLRAGLTPSPPTTIDDRFLQAFGTFQHDGKSFERIQAYVETQGFWTASREAEAPVAVATSPS